MTKPVSQALLKAVGETPLLTNILEMAGDLDHVQIARFNKTFHNAIQKLQARVCAHLSLAQSVVVLGQGARSGLSCETDFEGAWKELADAAESLDRRVTTAGDGIEDNRKVTYARYWNRMVGLKKSIEEETVPALREKWMRGLLAHLPFIRAQILVLEIYYSDLLAIAIEAYDAFFTTEEKVAAARDPLPNLLKIMEKSIACEAVSLRFRAIITEKSLNPETHPSASLAELHKKQKAEAASNAVRLVQFNEIAKSRTFSVPRFIEQEKVAIASELARHSELCLLWEATSRELNQLGIVLGDAMPHTPEEISHWFERQENQVHLARIEKLTCEGLTEVLPQLEKFSNLKELHLEGNEYGKISSLPAWLANLTCLHTLSLRHNAFKEIPPLLRTPMQYRQTVDLAWNPIKVFPDEVYRAYEFFGDNRMQLATILLEEMPFRFWFIEHWTLELPKIVYPSEHLRVDIPTPWYQLLYCGLMCVNLSLLLTPLISLFNVIQEGIVERLITLGRDLFGFSRMVKNTQE